MILNFDFLISITVQHYVEDNYRTKSEVSAVRDFCLVELADRTTTLKTLVVTIDQYFMFTAKISKLFFTLWFDVQSFRDS